eukprot:6455964-Pyramimonas_sp.AAC.1
MGNAALASLLAHGQLVPVDEAEELVRRKQDPGNKDRSKAASKRTVAQDSELISWSVFRGIVLGLEAGNFSSISPAPRYRLAEQDV